MSRTAVPDTKFESATNVARAAGQTGNICVDNNVSSFARAFRPGSNAVLHMSQTQFNYFFGVAVRVHWIKIDV